jgi:hypothetical protein
MGHGARNEESNPVKKRAMDSIFLFTSDGNSLTNGILIKLFSAGKTTSVPAKEQISQS